MNKGRVGRGRRRYLDTKKEKIPYYPAHRGSTSHAVSCALLYRHGLGHLGSHVYTVWDYAPWVGARSYYSNAAGWFCDRFI
jgi:hypothetical protein